MFVFFMISFADALVAIRTQGKSLLLREEPEIHSELLKEDKGEDGLRSKADKGGNVALVEGHRTLPQGGLEHIHRAGKFSWEKGLRVKRECFRKHLALRSWTVFSGHQGAES